MFSSWLCCMVLYWSCAFS